MQSAKMAFSIIAILITLCCDCLCCCCSLKTKKFCYMYLLAVELWLNTTVNYTNVLVCSIAWIAKHAVAGCKVAIIFAVAKVFDFARRIACSTACGTY